MTIASASMTFAGVQGQTTVDNDGTMNFTGDSCFMQSGVSVDNNGLFHVQTGEVRLTNQTLYTQSGGTTRVDARATFCTTNLSSFQGGVIEGEGTVHLAANLDNQALTVRPGASPGTLTIMSDYSQSSDGALEIELAGNGDGESDLLNVSDAATLGGNLNVVLVDDFVPQPDDSFVILTAAQVLGEFDNVNLVGFPQKIDIDVITEITSVTLVARLVPTILIDGFETQ